MVHAILSDAGFFALLPHVDEEIAAQVQACGCPRCGAATGVGCRLEHASRGRPNAARPVARQRRLS